MIRTREEALAELGEVHLPAMSSALRCALQDYVTEHANLRYRYTIRTEASIIHDLMVYHLQERLEGLPGVGFYTRRGLFMVGVSGRWVFRAKRLDRELRSKNIPTQQVLEFLAQVPQLEIQGAETATNLQIGYERSGAELATARIWITCPLQKGLVWSIQLFEDSMSSVIFSPASSPEHSINVQPILVHEAAQEETAAEGSNDANSG